jgi:hypothetical protein
MRIVLDTNIFSIETKKSIKRQRLFYALFYLSIGQHYATERADVIISS